MAEVQTRAAIHTYVVRLPARTPRSMLEREIYSGKMPKAP